MSAGRITQSMMSRQVLTDLTNVASQLSRTQGKLSSGKEITRPSDDPFGAGRAIALRGEVEGIAQYKRNVTDAQSLSEANEIALGQVNDAAQRTRELLVRGSTGTVSQTDRDAIAAEIDQLTESVKQSMGAAHAGRFIFSGSATDTKPYANGGSDAFAGNATLVYREIGRNVSIPVNVIGADVVGGGQAAGDDKLLHVLRDISDRLRSGTPADVATLGTTDLRRLDASLTELSSVRAVVGATTNRLDSAAASLAQLDETTQELLSQTENADMAKTLIDYSTQQAVYQSALKSGAQVIQPSLLDFLR